MVEEILDKSLIPRDEDNNVSLSNYIQYELQGSFFSFYGIRLGAGENRINDMYLNIGETINVNGYLFFKKKDKSLFGSLKDCFGWIQIKSTDANNFIAKREFGENVLVCEYNKSINNPNWIGEYTLSNRTNNNSKGVKFYSWLQQIPRIKSD